MPETNTVTQLIKKMDSHFNLNQIRQLCPDVGLDFDNIPGEGKIDKIRELLLELKRNGRLPHLQSSLQEARPNVNWSPFFIDSGTSPLNSQTHHILHPQNHNFIGRDAWLTNLHTQLSNDSTVAVTQAVAGLGGVGKTQLALAYCYRHLDDYDLIQWLRADDSATLDGEMAQMAYRLGIAPRTNSNHEQLRQLVLNWLHTTDCRWLLVFDNADHIQPEALSRYLPQMGNGANLITTRNPNWGGLAQTERLPQFTIDEAVRFLLGDESERMELELEEKERLAHEAEASAAVLGYLPLALEHARAYVAATGCSLADYAGYFATERDELWQEVTAPLGYDERTITTTWELAFAKVQETVGAVALLNLFCFVAPDEIPLDVLLETAKTLDELPDGLQTVANSKIKRDKAVAALQRFSLVSRQGERVAIHRLVQTVARDRLPTEAHTTWLTAAMRVLNWAWPFDNHDMTTWPTSATLLPHLLALLDHTSGQTLETSLVAELNGKAGFHLNYIGNYALAEQFYRRALDIAEKRLEPEDATLALRLNNLGSLLQAMGAYEEARPYLERALTINEKALGAEHPSVAIQLNDLGRLLQAIGEYEESRPYHERALTIGEKALGPKHPFVATYLSNLGHLLKVVMEYEEARLHMERALAIDEKALGAEHPSVAIRLNNLGQLLQAMGEYEKAKSYMERALAISEKALGAEHPSVAIRLNNLGMLMKMMGNVEAAQPFLERALAICENKLGVAHPNTQVARRNLEGLGRGGGE